MNASVDGDSVLAGGSCWAVGWRKVGGSRSFELFGDVAGHGNGHALFVEGDVHPEVCVTGGFNSELVIVGLEGGDEMIGVVLCAVFDAEVIDERRDKM